MAINFSGNPSSELPVKRVRKRGGQATYHCTERSRQVVLNFQRARGLPSASRAFDELMEYILELDPGLTPPLR